MRLTPVVLAIISLLLSCGDGGRTYNTNNLKKDTMATKIEHINPDSLFKSPAFSQVVTVEGSGKTIYIGGQDAVQSNNDLVGKGDLKAQTVQVMKNIGIALQAAGAGWKDVIKLSIFLKEGQNATSAFEAAKPEMKGMTHPPVITVVFVAGFGNPDFLLEIDAIAFTAGK